jgi:hypothetical protein
MNTRHSAWNAIHSNPCQCRADIPLHVERDRQQEFLSFLETIPAALVSGNTEASLTASRREYRRQVDRRFHGQERMSCLF